MSWPATTRTKSPSFSVAPAVPRHSTRVEYAQLLLQLLSGPPARTGQPTENLCHPVHGPAADRLRNLLKPITAYDRAAAHARRVLVDPDRTLDDVTDALRQVLNTAKES
ncbi:hypothetical protein NKH18_01300 [Streptomyces sp. M10(2022)]